MNESILIVLDSFEYKRKEVELKKIVRDYFIPTFYYTQYENSFIKFFHKQKVIGGLVTRISYWSISLASAFRILIKHRSARKKIFINPIVAIFYTFLTRLINRKENITISGFLFENKSNLYYYKFRKWFVNFSYANVNRIIVYSSKEVSYYTGIFPNLSDKMLYIKYGRDFDYLITDSFAHNMPYISSGGRSNRDFNTLCQAMEEVKINHPDLFCLIATRPESVSGISITPVNITMRYDIRLNKFGSFIDNSLYFILPLIETDISAGHMALLEAMSLGKIILTTDISSIRDYVDENTVFFYKSENKSDLAKKICYIYENIEKKEIQAMAQSSKNCYFTYYSFNAFLERIILTI